MSASGTQRTRLAPPEVDRYRTDSGLWVRPQRRQPVRQFMSRMGQKRSLVAQKTDLAGRLCWRLMVSAMFLPLRVLGFAWRW